MENKGNVSYDPMEIARILGEPKNPIKPYPDVVTAVCEVDSAEPDEYTYYFDVLAETDKVYIITSTGEVTQLNVTPDTPALLTFIDVASPEIYVKLTDLASAKEKVLARKVKAINRALDAYETWKVLQTIDGAVQSDKTFDLTSGQTRFSYNDMVNMIDSITDYADGYVFLAGNVIDKDIKLWDWNDNKYTSLASALKDLNVTIVRVFGQVYVDGTLKNIIDPNTAYLIGTNSVVGKPVLFVRKKLNSMEMIGGLISQDGSAPERLVFVSPNPIHATSGTNRYLAVGITGFGEVAIAVTNPYAISKFTRV